MIIRISGILLIVAATSMTGYSLGEKAKHQLKLLEGLRYWLTVFHSEVSYSGITLVEIAEQLSDQMSSGLDDMWCPFFGILADSLGSSSIDRRIEAIWEDSLYESGADKLMSDSDRQEFVRFGRELGCLDKASQLGRIDLYLEKVNMRIAETEKGLSERVRLCRLLGIAGGVFITILMV